MTKKLLKYGKILLAITLIGALALPSYATVGAADGSAFVTKAEFDAALSDFNARLTTFEAGINSKIDSQVSSYLDRNGIWNGKQQTMLNTNFWAGITSENLRSVFYGKNTVSDNWSYYNQESTFTGSGVWRVGEGSYVGTVGSYYVPTLQAMTGSGGAGYNVTLTDLPDAAPWSSMFGWVARTEGDKNLFIAEKSGLAVFDYDLKNERTAHPSSTYKYITSASYYTGQAHRVGEYHAFTIDVIDTANVVRSHVTEGSISNNNFLIVASNPVGMTDSWHQANYFFVTKGEQFKLHGNTFNAWSPMAIMNAGSGDKNPRCYLSNFKVKVY